MTPAPPDGILLRVADQTWEGTLHGYRVIVSSASGWHFAVINPEGHAEVCPRVASFAEGARRAREWAPGHHVRLPVGGVQIRDGGAPDHKPNSLLTIALPASQTATAKCRQDGIAANATKRATTTAHPMIVDQRRGSGGVGVYSGTATPLWLGVRPRPLYAGLPGRGRRGRADGAGRIRSRLRQGGTGASEGAGMRLANQLREFSARAPLVSK
jgi:hypothetical protein